MKNPSPRSRLWTQGEDDIILEIAGEEKNVSPVYIGMMKQKLPNRSYDSVRVRANMLVKGNVKPREPQPLWPRAPKNGDEQHVLAIMTLAEKIERRKKEEARASQAV